jgi:hypothetical protein
MLNQGNKVSDSTMLSEMGLNVADERDGILEGIDLQNILLKKQMKAQMEAQAESQQQQQAMMPDMQQQAMMQQQQQQQPGQDPASQGAAEGQAEGQEENVINFLDRVAPQIAQSPEEVQQRFLQHLGSQSPELANMMQAKLQQMSQSMMQPLPEQRAPRRGAGSGVI